MKMIIGVVLTVAVFLFCAWCIECHDETTVKRGELWHKDKKYEVIEVVENRE